MTGALAALNGKPVAVDCTAVRVWVPSARVTGILNPPLESVGPTAIPVAPSRIVTSRKGKPFPTTVTAVLVDVENEAGAVMVGGGGMRVKRIGGLAPLVPPGVVCVAVTL